MTIIFMKSYNTKYLYAIINNNQIYKFKNEIHCKYDILPTYINIRDTAFYNNYGLV